MKSGCLLLVTMLVVCASCSSDVVNKASAEPSPTPKSAAMIVAEAEDEFQSADDSYNDNLARTEARQSAINYFKEQLPAWNIKGVSAESYRHNSFVVGLDIEKKDERALIEFSVHKFFPESGNPYWKVTDIRATPEITDQALTEAALRQKLAATKAVLETFREKENGNE